MSNQPPATQPASARSRRRVHPEKDSLHQRRVRKLWNLAEETRKPPYYISRITGLSLAEVFKVTRQFPRQRKTFEAEDFAFIAHYFAGNKAEIIAEAIAAPPERYPTLVRETVAKGYMKPTHLPAFLPEAARGLRAKGVNGEVLIDRLSERYPYLPACVIRLCVNNY